MEGELPLRAGGQVGGLNFSVSVPGPEWLERFDGAMEFAPVTSDSGFELRLITHQHLQALEPLPVPWESLSQRGRVDDWCSEDFLAFAPPDAMFLVDRRRRQAIIYYESPKRVPMWDRCAPFRVALGFLGPLDGHHLVHSAALELKGKAILLVGQGGSGKSSTALVALNPESEFGFLSEDYTFVDEAENRVSPCFASFKVFPEAKERLPWLEQGQLLGEQMGKECRVLDREKLAKPCLLAAIVWPDRTSSEPISKVSKILALRKMAPSTLFQNPNPGQRDFQALTKLCRELPCFTLGLGDGPDAREVELRLRRLLDET